MKVTGTYYLAVCLAFLCLVPSLEVEARQNLPSIRDWDLNERVDEKQKTQESQIKTKTRGNYSDITANPIIGIFAQPSHDTSEACDGSCDYIAASYVKWVEGAGGRVVPIPYNTTVEEMEDLFTSVNGLLIPGGGATISPAAIYSMQRTIEVNDQGDYFPMWGTCMGFQWLMVGYSGNPAKFELDGVYNSENISLPLQYTTKAKESRLFRLLEENLYHDLETYALTLNNHHYGVTPKHFESTPSLQTMFDVLSVNKDLDGKPFISTVEAKYYPVYGIQWHTEKNLYEWGQNPQNGLPYEAINHSIPAQRITQYLGDFFIKEARKNDHKFSNFQQEIDSLIYNYSPSYTAPEFEQKYFFKKY